MDRDELYAWGGGARWSAAVFVAALPGTSAPVPLLQHSSPRLLQNSVLPCRACGAPPEGTRAETVAQGFLEERRPRRKAFLPPLLFPKVISDLPQLGCSATGKGISSCSCLPQSLGQIATSYLPSHPEYRLTPRSRSQVQGTSPSVEH